MKRVLFYSILLMCLQRACASQNNQKNLTFHPQAFKAGLTNYYLLVQKCQQIRRESINPARELVSIIDFSKELDFERAYGKIADK